MTYTGNPPVGGSRFFGTVLFITLLGVDLSGVLLWFWFWPVPPPAHVIPAELTRVMSLPVSKALSLPENCATSPKTSPSFRISILIWASVAVILTP
jgi:hypothetical protein